VFLALIARKLWLLWSRWEIPNNKDLYFWTERFTPIVRFLPLSFGLVAPLGLLGLALSLRRGRELFALWGFVCAYMVSVAALFCTARYRVPVIAPLLILAAQAFVRCLRALRRGRWKSLHRTATGRPPGLGRTQRGVRPARPIRLGRRCLATRSMARRRGAGKQPGVDSGHLPGGGAAGR